MTAIVPGLERHFHLGAAVSCLDGRAGTLHGLVVGRPAITVTHLVIRPGRPRGALLVVPGSRVVVPMGERLVLGITLGELRAMPPLGGDVLQVSRASLVECERRPLGVLDCVLVDPQTHRVTHLVVRKGMLIGHDLLIPVGWVRGILGHRIVLATTRAHLARLERFTTHRDAAQHVFAL